MLLIREWMLVSGEGASCRKVGRAIVMECGFF